MKGSKRSIISLLMMCLLIIAVFGGCSGNQQQAQDSTQSNLDSNSVSQTSEQSSASNTTQASGLPITKEPITINYLCSTHPTKLFTGSEPIFLELEKRTNIKINFTMVPDTAYDEKFKITIVSGSIPDLITATLDDAKKFGEEGAFLALDDLYREYGQNILKAMQETNTVGDLKAADGKYYILPKYADSTKIRTFMVREDWLKTAGLNAPDTVEDFYSMLKKFKDMNLGGEQTIPYSSFGLNLIESVFRIFGAQNDPVFRIDGDKLTYSPATDNMKQAVTFLNKLYKEKLLDNEFMTLSKKQWEERGASGIVGVQSYTAERTDFFTAIYTKTNPDAKMIPILPPKGPDGQRHTRGGDSLLSASYSTAVSSQTKYGKEIVQLFNYIFSDEGRELFSYGIENDTYTKTDGQPKYTDKIFQDDNITKYAIFGRRIPVWPLDTSEQLLANTLENEAIKMNSPFVDPGTPILTFTAAQTDELNKYQTSVNDKKDAYLLKFITGDEPLSNWDKYISDLNAAGLDKYIQIYNDAYAFYKK